MLTTSAVMTSPMRISLRLRLSSKSAAKDAQISMYSFVYQLLISALGPHLRARCQEDFELRVRENDGPHVAPVGDQAGRLAKGPLPLEQRPAHARQLRDLGGAHAAVLGADFFANILFFQGYMVASETDGDGGGELGQAPFFKHLFAEREQGDHPVKGAAFQIVKAERRGDAARDRALA